MSYYKVKNLSTTKDEKLILNVADSSIRPLKFQKLEYRSDGAALPDKLECFFASCLDGNFKLYAGCRYSDLVETGLQMKRTMFSVLPEEELWNYKLHSAANELVNSLIVNDIMLPGSGFDVQKTVGAVKGGTEAVLNQIRDMVFFEKMKWADAGMVPIRSAISSSLFPGYVVAEGKDSTWLCPKENYEPGILYSDGEGNIEFTGTDYGLFGALEGYRSDMERLPADTLREIMEKTDGLAVSEKCQWFTELRETEDEREV